MLQIARVRSKVHWRYIRHNEVRIPGVNLYAGGFSTAVSSRVVEHPPEGRFPQPRAPELHLFCYSGGIKTSKVTKTPNVHRGFVYDRYCG